MHSVLLVSRVQEDIVAYFRHDGPGQLEVRTLGWRDIDCAREMTGPQTTQAIVGWRWIRAVLQPWVWVHKSCFRAIRGQCTTKWNEEIKAKWKVGVRLKVHQSDYQLGWIEVWKKTLLLVGWLNAHLILNHILKAQSFSCNHLSQWGFFGFIWSIFCYYRNMATQHDSVTEDLLQSPVDIKRFSLS